MRYMREAGACKKLHWLHEKCGVYMSLIVDE